MKLKDDIFKAFDTPASYQNYEFQKIQTLDSVQALRYGFFRKSDFKKEKIKKIIISLNPSLKNINSSDPLIIAIKSLTKSFIGELIEFSKQLVYEFEGDFDWKEALISKKFIYYALKLNLFKHKQLRLCKNFI